MNLFHSILQKLGIEKPAAPAPAASAAAKPAPVTAAPAAAPAAKPAPVSPASFAATVTPSLSSSHPTPAPANPAPTFPQAAPGPARPAAIPMVDVTSKLEGLAKSKPGLDWKVSIVDMLKLLEIDSSYDARKELAAELGCPANLMNDSASMNIWLHKTVLQKIAENGGNIPDSLLH